VHTTIQNGFDSIFGCPVFVNDISSSELQLVNPELQKVIDKLSPDLSGSENYPWDRAKNGNKLNLGININIIEEYQLTNLKSCIFKCVENYLTKIQAKSCSFYIKDSWLVEMTQGDYLGKHNHGMSHISGVYYHSANADSGNFVLFPQGAQTVHDFPSTFSNSDFHAPSVHYKPQTGRIIMFPGWTDHCVTEYRSSMPRHSIPFNINLTLR
jgi:uncharacterized protein (TIGR02466 family)